MSKVRTIGYDEKVVSVAKEVGCSIIAGKYLLIDGKLQDIYGTLKVTPVSSGYCLGSSNWIIMTDYEKIVYVSGSSTLTTHPKYDESEDGLQ